MEKYSALEGTIQKSSQLCWLALLACQRALAYRASNCEPPTRDQTWDKSSKLKLERAHHTGPIWYTFATYLLVGQKQQQRSQLATLLPTRQRRAKAKKGAPLWVAIKLSMEFSTKRLTSCFPLLFPHWLAFEIAASLTHPHPLSLSRTLGFSKKLCVFVRWLRYKQLTDILGLKESNANVARRAT